MIVIPMKRLLLCLAVALLLQPPSLGHSAYIAYNTTAGIVPNKINVHLVPHTHDDVGWLKTVDQYYVGSRNNIQGACVKNVLDSVVEALLKDKNRRFIYVEQAFFQRWWRQQSDETKRTVKALLNSGQLEFINGGMCMHDEATTHYIDMIDQTTLGHRFIKEEFGFVPRIGWQIDPFGHSALQGYLLSAEVGFDALYFCRIDYQDKAKRKDQKSLEVVWRGSKTLGSSADIFTGITHRNYEPPYAFYFEVNNVKSIPVQDDPDLFDYNVEERVNDFVDAALYQANVTRTNHIMWTMGTDFQYQYANSWFTQMDKLIHYVNKDGRVNAFYSSPSIYTDAKYATQEFWPLKTGDFFPYADQPNAYWTGYFTSRPALKGYVRALSAYYLAARQLEFLKGRYKVGLDSLADALAIAQHHDAITGTEKQHVADDYAKRLAIGYTEAEKLVGTALACLTETSKETCQTSSTQFEQCPLLNITYCPPSEKSTSNGKGLVVLVYNSLGWEREDVVQIPVSNEYIVVRDSAGTHVEAQLLPIDNASLELRKKYVKAYLGTSPDDMAKFWLVFSVSVPPLGFSTYFITSAKQTEHSAVMSTTGSPSNSLFSNKEVGKGNLRLLYDGQGNLIRYINIRTMVNNSVEQAYSYYSGATGDQNSGAYIFRPSGEYTINSSKQPVKILQGPIVDEVHQSINPWIYQISRVYKGKEHVEVNFIVGPIPINDFVGKEVVTKIGTTVQSNKTFFTDSNGRDFIKRIRDYRPEWNLDVHEPVSGNYYPINLGIYIKDGTTEFSVLVDRSVGGSSIQDGQVELMLHRRLLFDDSRGVDEPLDETVDVNNESSGLVIQGKIYFRFDHLGAGTKWRRSVGQHMYSPLLIAFAEQDVDIWTASHRPNFTAMDPSYSLPDNVAIITLQALDDSGVLLRLAHLYEDGEDKDLSVLAQVDLKKVFPDKKIKKVTETSLSANQKRVDMEKKRLVWKVEQGGGDETKLRGGPIDPFKLVVELAPMEIRTFIIHFDIASAPLSDSKCRIFTRVK